MAKRGWTIVLDKKVGKPRERIRNHERRKDEPRTAQDNRRKQKRPACKRSHGVKNASQRLAVRENIVRPRSPRRYAGPAWGDSSAECAAHNRKKTLPLHRLSAAGQRQCWVLGSVESCL
jgi:hypothetical protein